MAKPHIEFTEEEKLLVQEVQKSPGYMDINKVAELLAERKGDIVFNTKLRYKMRSLDEDSVEYEAMQMLSYYSFKTKGFGQASQLVDKLKTMISQIYNYLAK